MENGEWRMINRGDRLAVGILAAAFDGYDGYNSFRSLIA